MEDEGGKERDRDCHMKLQLEHLQQIVRKTVEA